MTGDENQILQKMADLAKILDGDEFLDGTSKLQKKAFRDVADTLQVAMEKEVGPITPPTLMAFLLGATTQATVQAKNNPLAGVIQRALGGEETSTTQADTTVLVVVGYLARDLLAGERIG